MLKQEWNTKTGLHTVRKTVFEVVFWVYGHEQNALNWSFDSFFRLSVEAAARLGPASKLGMPTVERKNIIFFDHFWHVSSIKKSILRCCDHGAWRLEMKGEKPCSKQNKSWNMFFTCVHFQAKQSRTLYLYPVHAHSGVLRLARITGRIATAWEHRDTTRNSREFMRPWVQKQERRDVTASIHANQRNHTLQ